jgi:hypothetical protein
LVALDRQSVQWRVLSVLWACVTLHRLRKWSNSSGSVLCLCTLIKDSPRSRSKLPSSLSCSTQLEIWPSCTLAPVSCLSHAQGRRRRPSRILFRSQPPLSGLFTGNSQPPLSGPLPDQETDRIKRLPDQETTRIKRQTLQTQPNSGHEGDGDGLAGASVGCQLIAPGVMEQHRRSCLVGRNATACARSATRGRLLVHACCEATSELQGSLLGRSILTNTLGE